MHYLVTGGCGFIGSHLVEKLLAAGHHVSVIDDLSTGKRGNIPSGVRLRVGDITAPGVFDELVAQADGCFHLAAIASVQRSQTEWLRTHQVNLGGTVALFDAIARAGRPIPVVLASSAAIYGDAASMPIHEDTPQLPLSAYGADKLACEWQARIAAHLHDIPAIGLRFFNVYGPRQDPSSPYSGVISIFADRMRAHAPVTIFGDGEQVRDFIYVADIVSGLAASMQALEHKRLIHGVFNLCTGRHTSVNHLAELVKRLTESTSVIAHGEARPGDIRMSVGDASAAYAALGFTANTFLQHGLVDTLQAFQ